MTTDAESEKSPSYTKKNTENRKFAVTAFQKFTAVYLPEFRNLRGLNRRWMLYFF